ncbi:MAG: insulinase family protein [Alphaproteobacteria bacterium]|nr:insulinase family protein [Alphaproteobacteria bacterium]
MIKRFSFVILFSCLLLTSACKPEKIYNAETFTLSNGLQVVVVENHRAPVVAYALWVKAGSADEVPGQSGVAHFLEHLMFKGTPTLKPGEYSRKMRSWGANENAFTSYDYTGFFATISKDKLENALALEADRLQNLAPPLDHVASERLVVIEERRQRTENDPRAIFFEKLDTKLYPDHPYGRPIIGWHNEMEQLDWPRSKSFIDKWYSPSNMALVFSGDITVAEARSLAKKYFMLKDYKVPAAHTLPDAQPLATREIVKGTDPLVEQPIYAQKFLAPNLTQDHKAALALLVIQDVIAGNAASRFYQSLVVEQKVATSVNVSYDPFKRSTSEIIIWAVPAEGVSFETINQKINEEVAALIQDGIPNEKIAESKKRLIESAAYARDSLMGPVMDIGRALSTGATLDDIEMLPVAIEGVTQKDIANALRLIAPDKGNITGWLEKGDAQ